MRPYLSGYGTLRDSPSSTERIFSVHRDSTGNGGILDFSAEMRTNDTIRMYQRYTGVDKYTDTTSTYNDDAWHHVLIVVDNSSTLSASTVIYTDGVAETTSGVNASGTPEVADGVVVIGGEYDDANETFEGKIAEVAIWDRQLSAGEALTLAAGASPDLIPTPYYYWPLLEDADEKQGLLPGTVRNTATLSTDHPQMLTAAVNLVPA